MSGMSLPTSGGVSRVDGRVIERGRSIAEESGRTERFAAGRAVVFGYLVRFAMAAEE
jgi:hypothetical protein